MILSANLSYGVFEFSILVNGRFGTIHFKIRWFKNEGSFILASSFRMVLLHRHLRQRLREWLKLKDKQVVVYGNIIKIKKKKRGEKITLIITVLF